VTAMGAIYRTGVTVEEIQGLDRPEIIAEFLEDAIDEYNEKEKDLESMEAGLMRWLERYVILQVVDTRWREHLENMEYLREGVHLRAMAQKDPLVEYRAEGHVMFEELSLGIHEEVVSNIFHAQLEPQDASTIQALQQAEATDGDLSYQHESIAGAEAIAAAGAQAGALGTAAGVLGGGATSVATAQRVTSEHEKLGRNDPCWCGSGKKFKKCHGA
jgi:preprotein translocase subunit SecA